MYLTICIIVFDSITAKGQDAFDLIRSKIVKHQANENNMDATIKNVISYLPQQLTDGHWADINYTDTTITQWNPIKHLDRIKSFALAYVNKDNFYSGNAGLYTSIENGLRFWLSSSPHSANWWHNEIAAPQTIGEILLIIQSGPQQLPADLSTALINAMKKGNPYKQTGANKLDIAIHFLYRACYTKNAGLMDSAVKEAFQPISFTTGEGLQYDYSYMQHKTQLQISSYGLVFITGEYKVASWVQGTSYALSGDKLKMLDTYLTSTFLKTIRGRYIDFNTEGRGISRPDILDKYSLAGKSTYSLLSVAKEISPANGSVINDALQRIQQNKPADYNVSASHNFFWKGDYTVHVRPTYSFNVRTVSIRTIRTETGNKENLIGKFLPDGSTNIQRTGSEYFNIMPVWEWDKIPGVTSRDFNEDQPMSVQWGEKGSTVFTGGVSDGVYGCTVYDMNYNDVKAKKTWFFFDKEIVCAGTSISSSSNEPVITTINQCWQKGKGKYAAENKTEEIKKSEHIINPSWVWHDSIGYVFLQPSDVFVSSIKQKGSWARINSGRPKEELEGSVFKLWLSHGTKPADSSYAYCVVPSVALNEMNTNRCNEIKVVSNNNKVQAVYHSGLDMLQVVFYEAGEITVNDFKLNAGAACTILVKQMNSKQPSIWLADPSQQLAKLELKIQLTGDKNVQVIMCDLPAGNFAGSSKQVNITAVSRN